jgi:arsenite methyltransferase
MRKQLFYIVILLSIFVWANCDEQHKRSHAGSRFHSFEDTERYVKRFEDPERQLWQKPDEVVRAMNIRSGHIIADIGAGSGYFTRRFAQVVSPGGIAIGYDIEPGMVDYMRGDAQRLRMHNYRAELIDPQKPALEENYFDLIFLCNAYHHISDRVDYLKIVKRSLKRQGRIIIVDYYKNVPYGPPNYKIPKTDVKDEFRQAGYRNTKDLGFLPRQYYLEFVKE